MLDTLHIKYNRCYKIFHPQRLIMVRQPLYIDSQYHNIAQSSAIKMLLRYLERCYTAKNINNHADSTNGMCFIFNKFSYLLKLLTDFNIRGTCLNKPSG